jgi:ribose transport system substrate-binding protein
VEPGSAAARVCETVPALEHKSNYTIGFVQIYEPNNAYTAANTGDMLAAAQERKFKVVYDSPTTADPVEQSARIQALIDAKVDAIVWKPVGPAVVPAAIAARKACIPIFTESRFLDPNQTVAGRDYVTHIGTDGELQSRMIADWLIKAKGGRAEILELEGVAGASSAIARKKGFDEEIATAPDMKIIASHSANFEREMARDVVKRLVLKYPTANAIFSANDPMALGAVVGVKDAGKVPGKDIIIVTIDGYKETVSHVIDGSIAAVVFNSPRLGGVTMDTIERYGAGERIPAKVVVRGPIIDRTNASSMIDEAY